MKDDWRAADEGKTDAKTAKKWSFTRLSARIDFVLHLGSILHLVFVDTDEEEMEASPSRLGTPGQLRTGQKRPAAALLPAFEPQSSSPPLPRPLKRTRGSFENSKEYPTPVPSSSTLIPSSSPRHEPSKRDTPPRTKPTVSERAPFSSVPTIQLPSDSKPVRLGRSTVSCHYQLSSHIMVSRIHIEARTKLADADEGKDQLEILCTGWNGAVVRCQGEAYRLSKGMTFTSDRQAGDIVIAVHDTSVILKWPATARKVSTYGDSSSASEEENSPTRLKASRRHSVPSSPIQPRRRVTSPVSPSPAAKAAALPSSPLSSALNPVLVYEDETAANANEISQSATISQSTQIASQPAQQALSQSVESSLSEPQDFSDNDEENDPIILSFGPSGANLLPRMESINTHDSVTGSPRSALRSRAKPLKPTDSPPQPKAKSLNFDAQTHIVNQLAFSRLASTPLSTILAHLPHDLGNMPVDDVQFILNSTTCIGEVAREGKDAAGKPLESEYYYMPDQDEDFKRKEAVVNDLMKPPLRSCRKQHKQYYWKKPK